jgi:hypothetical protein
MENTARTRMLNELDTLFAGQERSAGIQQTRAGTRLTERQAEGTETANQAAQIDLEAKQQQQAFLNSSAQQAGFTKALPNETVGQYGMRMKAVGNDAEVQNVVETTKKLAFENSIAPEKWKHQKTMDQQQMAINRGQLGVAQGNLALQRQQDERQRQDWAEQKVEKNFGAFVRGFSKGEVAMPPEFRAQFSDEQSAKKAFLLDTARRFIKSNNLNMDEKVAVVLALDSAKSAEASAAANDLVNTNNNPVERQTIEAGLKGKRVSEEATSALAMLNNSAKRYSGAGVAVNDEQARAAADEIRSQLLKLSAADPIFTPFLKRFEEIDAKLYENPLLAAKNIVTRPFDDAPAVKFQRLVRDLASTIQSSLVGVPRHRYTDQALQMSQQTLDQVKSQVAKGNILDDEPAEMPEMPGPQNPATMFANPMQQQPMPNSATGWAGGAAQQTPARNPLQFIQQQRQGGNPGW